MMVADNYGARWVKSMLNWVRAKTLEGYPYPMLVKDAVWECGLKRGKAIELINEWLECGFISNQGQILIWTNENMKVSMNENLDPRKAEAYYEAKKKVKAEKEEVIPPEKVKEMLREKFKGSDEE